MVFLKPCCVMASTVEEQLSVEMRKTMALALVIKNGWTGTIAPPKEDVNLGKFVECAGLALFEAKKRQAMRMTQNSPYVIFVQYLGLTTAVPSEGGETILGLKQSIMNSLQIYYGVHPDKYLLFFYVSEGVFLKNNLKRVSSSFGAFAEICVIEKGEFGRVLMGEQPRGHQVDVESLVNASRDDEARAKAKAKAMAVAGEATGDDVVNAILANIAAAAKATGDAVGDTPPAPVAGEATGDAVGDTPPAPVAGEATGDAVDNVSTDVWMKVAGGTKQLLVNCNNPLQDENVKLLRMSVSNLNGYLTVDVFYHKNAGCDDLMRVISSTYNIDKEAFSLKFRSGSVLQPFDGLDAYNTEGEVFKLTPKVLGGGVFRKTKKTYTKRAVAVSDIKKTFKDNLVKTDIPDGQAFDEDFNKVMANYEGMLGQARMLKASGQNIFQLAVHHLDTDELNLVKEIIGEKTGRKTTEDKLVKIAQVVYPPLKAVERAGKSLARLHEEMTAEICGFYTDEFCVFANGAVRFDNTMFEALVDKELSKRQLVSENSAGYAPQSASSCVVC